MPDLSVSERITSIRLDDASIIRRSAEAEQERATAINDLLYENNFSPAGAADGPYDVFLSVRDNRLRFEIRSEHQTTPVEVALPLASLRNVIKDYFLICDSYFEAMKAANSYKIEALDMSRRSVHNEGSALLQSMLEGKITLDSPTARRLFTLICVLHIK